MKSFLSRIHHWIAPKEITLEFQGADLRKFSRRFGQPIATLTAMQYAGAAVVVMDAHLQDPPELVNEIVAKWRAGFEVVGIVRSRSTIRGSGQLQPFLGFAPHRVERFHLFLQLSADTQLEDGFVIAGGSFLIAILYAIMRISCFPFPLGNRPFVILILFMGGIQVISVGILGEYITRICDEVKRRPKFIVDETAGLESAAMDARRLNVSKIPAGSKQELA